MAIEQWVPLGAGILAYAAMSFVLYRLLVSTLQERCSALEAQCSTLKAQCGLLETQVLRGGDLAGRLAVVERSYQVQIEELKQKLAATKDAVGRDAQENEEVVLREKEALHRRIAQLRKQVEEDQKAGSLGSPPSFVEITLVARHARPEWSTVAGTLAQMLAVTTVAGKCNRWHRDEPSKVLCEKCGEPMAMWGAPEDLGLRHHMCLNIGCEYAGSTKPFPESASLIVPCTPDEVAEA